MMKCQKLDTNDLGVEQMTTKQKNMNQDKARNGKILKVYVVGYATDYANWLPCTITRTMEEADLVLFTGGEDIHPRFYKDVTGRHTDTNVERDMFEWKEADKATMLKKPIFGTCRGAQLGCVYSGGRLVQHMNHPYIHTLTMYDGSTVQTNSLHHQLQHPYSMKSPLDFVVAGWSKGLSNVYLNGDNDNMLLPSNQMGQTKEYIKEAELVYYRKTNWLGIQGHPEMLAYNCTLNNMLRAMVTLLIEGTLDLVLTLGIPFDRYVNKDLVILDDELQTYEGLVEKRASYEVEVDVN